MGESQWYFARQQDERAVKSMLTFEIARDSGSVDRAIRRCHEGPRDGGWGSCLFIPIGKAVQKRTPTETAVHWRNAKHSIDLTTGYGSPRGRSEWVNDVYNILAPHKVGTYVNYPDVELQDYAN